MENIEKRFLTVGELAGKAGITVRTLQYYDRIGLLKSTLSEGGRRMYTCDDILKLQQILFLKSFGFPLEEISNKILNYKTSADLEKIFTEQSKILHEQISNMNKTVNMLDIIIEEIRTGKDISFERLIAIIESMSQGNPYTFFIRYFGDEQLNSVAKRFSSKEESQQYIESMKELFTQLNTLYKKDADPAGKEGQELAARWWTTVCRFTGGDSSLMKTLLSVGKDIDNWPEGTENIKDAIEHFLTKAFSVYFKNNNIKIPEMEVRNNE